MAYAAAKFAEACMQAMAGASGVIECAYVASHLTELPYFASPLKLGSDGVKVRSLAHVDVSILWPDLVKEAIMHSSKLLKALVGCKQ